MKRRKTSRDRKETENKEIKEARRRRKLEKE